MRQFRIFSLTAILLLALSVLVGPQSMCAPPVEAAAQQALNPTATGATPSVGRAIAKYRYDFHGYTISKRIYDAPSQTSNRVE